MLICYINACEIKVKMDSNHISMKLVPVYFYKADRGLLSRLCL